MKADVAGENLGWKAPDFQLPDLDGAMVSFSDTLGSKGAAVIFMCNHCPYVKAIMTRLVDDARLLKDEGIGILGVMSNDYVAYPADSPDAMRAFAAQHELPFPYLLDQDQGVARAFGALCTPDVFGFNAEGALQYRGRFDSAGMGSADGRSADLLNAMRHIASTGQGPAEQVASIGCSIKWRV